MTGNDGVLRDHKSALYLEGVVRRGRSKGVFLEEQRMCQVKAPLFLMKGFWSFIVIVVFKVIFLSHLTQILHKTIL